MNQPIARRVVIVGGGVAGLELATRLSRSRRGASDHVTLIDRSLSHFWKPMLHTLAAGTERSSRRKISYLAEAKASGFRFWPGLLVGVDRTRKLVKLVPDIHLAGEASEASENAVPFDILVLALGSRSNDFGTPGVAEHCLAIDDVAGAEVFRNHLRRTLFGSAVSGSEATVAIVGGGPTGVELAAELRRAFDLIAGFGEPRLARRTSVTIIQGGPLLLPTFPRAVSDGAARQLTKLGIAVRTGEAVVGADAEGFLLKGGDRVDAEIKVWAAGIKAPDVLGTIEGLERSRSGQLVVNARLQCTNDTSIFALGDCAFFAGDAGGQAAPATAQVAHQQARYLSTTIGGAGAHRPFRYRDLGSIVSLSDYAGWGTVGRHAFGGATVSGLLARAAHALLYRQHQVGVHGIMRGAGQWLLDDLEGLTEPRIQLD